MPAGRHGALADGAVGILMALLRREKTGRATTLDISMQDSSCSRGRPTTSARSSPRTARRHEERAHAGAATAFYNVYRCATAADRARRQRAQVRENLLNALGRPDLVALCRLPPGRGQDPVRDFLAATFLTRTARRVGALLRRHRLLLGARQGPRRGDAQRPPEGARDAGRVPRRPDPPRHPDQVRRRARRDPAGRAGARRALAQRARRAWATGTPSWTRWRASGAIR